MSKKFSLIIFTDLDGSLLHRDNFKFDEIKDYVKNLINHVRTTNNRNIATLEKEIVKLASSTTIHMQIFIQTIFE